MHMLQLLAAANHDKLFRVVIGELRSQSGQNAGFCWRRCGVCNISIVAITRPTISKMYFFIVLRIKIVQLQLDLEMVYMYLLSPFPWLLATSTNQSESVLSLTI